jgi:pyrroline-5-carboxylate reductase
MKVSFIGCGTMGEALLTAILYRGLSTREDVTVSDIVVSPSRIAIYVQQKRQMCSF